MMKKTMMNKTMIVGLAIFSVALAIFMFGCAEPEQFTGETSEPVILVDNSSLEQCQEQFNALYAANKDTSARNLELGKQLAKCRETRSTRSHKKSNNNPSSNECPQSEDTCTEIEEANQALTEQVANLQAQVDSLTQQLADCQAGSATCQEDLTQCQADAANCQADIAECQDDATECQEDLEQCKEKYNDEDHGNNGDKPCKKHNKKHKKYHKNGNN